VGGRKTLVLTDTFSPRTDYTPRTMETSPKKIRILARNKLNEYKRVIKISDKPDREEFSMSAKVTGAGIVITGGIGMAFYLVSNLLPGAV